MNEQDITRLNYEQGIKLMKSLSDKKGTFEPHPGIIINYPGKKSSGDYRLSLRDNTAPKHAQISLRLHELITSGAHTFDELNNFLIDVYNNGTMTHYESESLEDLKHLIFWITLQEEINFPKSKGYASINFPYCRYYEAIYSTQSPFDLTIQAVQERCENHGGPKPDLLPIPNAPHFYTYN